jgi:hypothetical protein
MSLAEKAEMARQKACHARYLKALGSGDTPYDQAFTPSSVAIKRNKVGNIDNARLWRRRAYLISLFQNRADIIDGRNWGFGVRVAELMAIEDELATRTGHEIHNRYTLPPSQRTRQVVKIGE